MSIITYTYAFDEGQALKLFNEQNPKGLTLQQFKMFLIAFNWTQHSKPCRQWSQADELALE